MFHMCNCTFNVTLSQNVHPPIGQLVNYTDCSFVQAVHLLKCLVPNAPMCQMFKCANSLVWQMFECVKYSSVPNIPVCQIFVCAKFSCVSIIQVCQIFQCAKYSCVPNFRVCQMFKCASRSSSCIKDGAPSKSLSPVSPALPCPVLVRQF